MVKNHVPQGQTRVVTLRLDAPKGPDIELLHLKLRASIASSKDTRPPYQVGARRGKRPYTPARGPSTDASPGTGQGWRVATGGSGGLLRGAGAPYLAVGRRGGLRVQLTAARKEERERERGVKTSRPLACPLQQALWITWVVSLWLPRMQGGGWKSSGARMGSWPGQVNCAQSRGARPGRRGPAWRRHLLSSEVPEKTFC